MVEHGGLREQGERPTIHAKSTWLRSAHGILRYNRTRPSSELRSATSSRPPPSGTWKRLPSTRVCYPSEGFWMVRSFILSCRVRPAQALHPNCLLHLLRHPLQGRSSSIWQARSRQLEEDPNPSSSTQVQGRKGVYNQAFTCPLHY